MKTLYICYFGLREPLVQTQVLPYLRQLSYGGVGIDLLTFEQNWRRAWTQAEAENWRERLRADGIRWSTLPYHKRPPVLATLYDTLRGAWAATRIIRRRRIDVIHARSHVPMLMAMLTQFWTNCRLVFDFRGFIADEYVDAGVWRENSLPFRAVKLAERAGLRRADQVVVLTRRMRDWLAEQQLADANKIEVVPCCVDFSRFDGEKDSAPTSEAFEVVYAGAVTGLYLLEEMGRFFMEVRARRPDALLRVLTTSQGDDAAATLRRVGLSVSDFWIGSVRPSEVPAYLRRARLGISFRKPTFSQIAASPTKIPEYLAAGLPVVSNAGIGDMDELLERERVGVIVKDFNQGGYAKAAERALVLAESADARSRCVHVARRDFDLIRVGGAGYRNIYRRIGEQARVAGTGS